MKRIIAAIIVWIGRILYGAMAASMVGVFGWLLIGAYRSHRDFWIAMGILVGGFLVFIIALLIYMWAEEEYQARQPDFDEDDRKEDDEL
jgi:hypothetical protein